MKTLSRWATFNPVPPLPDNVWRLLAVRVLRSFNQGYLNVVTPLYLLSLGVSVAGLGALFTASFLVGAVLTLAVGILADRIGRKPFLIIFTLLIFTWGALYTSTTFLPALLTISAIAGIGRGGGGGGGGGGQGGPFGPAESAMLADLVPRERRTNIFAFNAFLATLAAAIGTAASGLPVWLGDLHAGFLASDRLLFAVTAAIGLISLALFWGLPEPIRRKRERQSGLLSPAATGIVIRQSLAAACNSLGTGLVSSMLVVWFNLRFHVGADAIGPMLAASYVLSSAGFFVAARIARRTGSVRAIVGTRVIAAALVAALAFAPTFFIAALIQIARQVVTQTFSPVRQSFTMGLVSTEERASVSGMTGVVRRLSAAFSPSLSGFALDQGALEIPFEGSALLQVVSAGLYYWFFLRLDDRPAPVAEPVPEPPLEVG